MTPKIYPDNYTAADIIADVIWTDEGTLRGTVTEAAQALKDAGRLTPAPQIIRTVEELEALDPETIVQRRPQYPGQYSRTETAGDLAYVVRRWGTTTHLPAVVVTPASQVRAARKALKEA